MSEEKPSKFYIKRPSSERNKPSGFYIKSSEQTTGTRFYVKQPEPVPASPVDPHAVILGLDTLTNQPIVIKQADLCEGTYIVGVQGMGKTSLLEQIIYQQMQRNEAVIVIDPHGDLVNSIIAHMPERRLDKTYLLDLTDRKYPFGLNAFICNDPTDEEKRDGTRNQIMHAFSKLWPEVLEQQYFKIYLPHIVITLIENPELTLANVERLLDDAEYRQRYTRHIKNARTREFWQHYEKLNDNQKRIQTSSLRGRLDQLLTEPVIYNILRQTKKTVNIRELIEERAILLVKLPVNEEEYKYTAPVIGTFLMAMIYAATFSFADIPNIDDRPGFTLIVDEFQNFATDEYAKLFEQGRKYKVKQFLAHQHRQQLEREQKGRTNLAATLTAQTIIAFKTPNPTDSRELASKFTSIGDKRRPTDISIHPLEKINKYPHPTVKQFVLDVVDRLDKASGQKLATGSKFYEVPKERWYGRHHYTEWVTKSYTYKVNPEFDFGAGWTEASPKKAEEALTMLDRLIYESEEQGKIIDHLKAAFIKAVTPFWKLESTRDEAVERAKAKYGAADFAKLSDKVRNLLIQEQEQELAGEARQRLARFVRLLDTVLAILIKDPIANDATLSNADIAGLLESLEKRHAFVKTGSTAYAMETRDTELLQTPVTAQEAAKRLRQVREQTRARYCVSRAELAEREAEAIEEETHETPPPEALQPEPELLPMDMQEPEPILEEVPEPEIRRPELPARKEQKQPPEQEQIPASMDTINTLYAQFKTRNIDPDTTILAALGEHYVLTIRQWMRLFTWKAYPKATAHFKTLVDTKLIVRKDREGRGGTLVSGDWFFLLTKGANELVRRKQASPPFKLEPNEAAKASGDALFHTFLVNEVLIHLRLLERTHPDILTIEGIDHERSMRRNYIAALGSDTKLYPDGFLRLLVPTPNGLKRKYTFLELQHTTQKDKHNWQSKVRKYLDLFARTETLEKYFHTRTPRVLVLTMDEEYVSYHTKWTEEVLAERGEKGRAYGNRFLIGSYDTGISDMSVEPLQFFCTPRFYQPFTDTPYPVFAPPEQTP